MPLFTLLAAATKHPCIRQANEKISLYGMHPTPAQGGFYAAKGLGRWCTLLNPSMFVNCSSTTSSSRTFTDLPLLVVDSFLGLKEKGVLRIVAKL